MNEIVLVLGSWGSGTTAVTGVIDRLGGYTCPPHFNTNDPRTLCSYESHELRNILLRYINEHEIMVIGRREYLIEELLRWLKCILENNAIDGRLIALKHPLLSIILPDLLLALNPKIINVVRPYVDIERSRIRRNWPAIYGEEGARRLNDYAANALENANVDVIDISYPELLACPVENVLKIARFCELGDDASKFDDAIKFIKV